MVEVLTAAQMKAIEAAAMASGEVTGLELMERAGAGVVEAIFAAWPQMQRSPARAVVLCGPGNNGGDGYVVARLLQGWGWQVQVAALAAPVTADARAMRAARGGPVIGISDLDWPDFRASALVVDAMFGIGLVRDVAAGVWGLLEMAKTSGCKLVAVDILSGLCADSGRVRAEGGYLDWPADLTVTFERPKPGHYLDIGGTLAGALVVVPLRLDRQMDALLRADQGEVVDLASFSAAALRKGGGHKFSHGHALIVSGDHGQAGAARLCARGALRIGAGLVTVASPPGAMAENAARLDAVMLRPVADAAGLAGVLEDQRINALCLGPGMGLNAWAAELVRGALETSRLRVKPGAAQGLAVVLDADALTVIARDAGLFALLHEGCVLTPHAGEFARLFPDIAARLAAPAVTGPAYSKVDATREAARRAGCVVLYKGADTVIAAPDGRCAINAAVQERSAPWLATAGSGDVLAGFITGLLARGFAPLAAAETAAWLHVECARSFGPGLIAEDLPEALPKVLRRTGV